MEDQNLAPDVAGADALSHRRPVPRPLLPSPRLRSWVLDVTASSACTPLGDGRFVLRIPVDQLAVELGYTPRSGSLSRRLRRLQECGVVVSRRPVVFDVSRLTGPASAATRPPGDRPSVCHLPSVTTPEGPRPDAAANTALLALESFRLGDREVSLRALDVLACLRSEPAVFDARNEIVDARIADGCARDDGPMPLLSEKKTSPSSSDFALTAAMGRPSPPRVAGRRQHRLDELLRPLLDECDRRGLPGVSSRAGVHAALGGLSDLEIASGVEAVCALLAAGAPLRSPVGLLVSLARRGELQASRTMRAPKETPDVPAAVPPTSAASVSPSGVSGQRVVGGDGDGWLRDVRAFMTADLSEPGGSPGSSGR